MAQQNLRKMERVPNAHVVGHRVDHRYLAAFAASNVMPVEGCAYYTRGRWRLLRRSTPLFFESSVRCACMARIACCARCTCRQWLLRRRSSATATKATHIFSSSSSSLSLARATAMEPFDIHFFFFLNI